MVSYNTNPLLDHFLSHTDHCNIPLWMFIFLFSLVTGNWWHFKVKKLFFLFITYLTNARNYFQIQSLCLSCYLRNLSLLLYENSNLGGPSRWQRSKTWRSPSSPQIHQKYIYMWNNSYRTPTECWQKTSGFPKGKKLPTYLGRAKEERKNRHKRTGTGPALLQGSCEGGKVSTH